SPSRPSGGQAGTATVLRCSGPRGRGRERRRCCARVVLIGQCFVEREGPRLWPRLRPCEAGAVPPPTTRGAGGLVTSFPPAERGRGRRSRRGGRLARQGADRRACCPREAPAATGAAGN